MARGGRPEGRATAQQGFGTKLIERSAAHELGGVAHLEYLKEGLRCELIFSRSGS
jgi:two-component sensor histidine kinase